MNVKVLQRSRRGDEDNLPARNIEVDIKIQGETILPIEETRHHLGTMMEDLIIGHFWLRQWNPSLKPTTIKNSFED